MAKVSLLDDRYMNFKKGNATGILDWRGIWYSKREESKEIGLKMSRWHLGNTALKFKKEFNSGNK